MSQFAKDTSVLFEFHSDKCLVKFKGMNKVLRGVVGLDGLYSFNNVQLHGQPSQPQFSYKSTGHSPQPSFFSKQGFQQCQ